MRLSKDIMKDIAESQKEFSGVISVKQDGKVIFENSYGYANRSHKVENKINTKFGIASGTKLLTAIAIGQLVEKGKITFKTYLKDCLDITFPHFDSNITVEHLLTHSSGIPDYFDEEVMDDYSELWIERPMYNIRSLKDFLPLFQDRQMDFKPGEKFKYNNSGFIVLGLIVEHQSGMSFIEYITKNILEACDMNDSGYFYSNKLPENTALGYVKEESGEWRTNIYDVPIIGGSDGGVYTTAEDLSKLWEGIFSYRLLSKDTVELMFTPHLQEEDTWYYGYGVWMIKEQEILKYFIMGYDPGVSMFSSFFPKHNIIATVLGNTEYGSGPISRAIQDCIKEDEHENN